MSFVTNILTPILQLSFYIFMIGGGIFLTYYLFKSNFPNLRWWIKYSLFRRNFKDADVEWCVDAIERGFSYVDAKAFLLKKGTNLKRVHELMFVFNKVAKELKGGEKNGRQFKGQNSETQQIQKIS